MNNTAYVAKTPIPRVYHLGMTENGRHPKKRFKDIEQIVLPFLYNLSKSDEPYIHWRNRGPIIKAQIEKILKLTRG